MQSKCYLEIVRLCAHQGMVWRFFLITWETFGSGASKVRSEKSCVSILRCVDNEHNKQTQSYSVCHELRQQSLSQADCSQGIAGSVLG